MLRRKSYSNSSCHLYYELLFTFIHSTVKSDGFGGVMDVLEEPQDYKRNDININ